MRASRSPLVAPLSARALVATTAMATCACAVLAGCGGQSSTGATSSGPNPSASVSSPSASVSGPTVTEQGAQLHLPAGWTVRKEANGVSFDAPRDSKGHLPAGGDIQSRPDPFADTEDSAKSILKAKPQAGYTNVKRLPNVKIHGTTLYHIQYENDTSWWDSYGAAIGGNDVGIVWESDKAGYSRAQATKTITSVMATFTPTS